MLAGNRHRRGGHRRAAAGFPAGGDDLAYLQYTSGSTSTPKGVMVSHTNVLHTLEDLDLGWRHGPDSVMVTWLPLFHDMGLIYGILQPLRGGFPCYMIDPAAFLQRPARWLEAISVYGGTHALRRTSPSTSAPERDRNGEGVAGPPELVHGLERGRAGEGRHSAYVRRRFRAVRFRCPRLLPWLRPRGEYAESYRRAPG